MRGIQDGFDMAGMIRLPALALAIALLALSALAAERTIDGTVYADSIPVRGTIYTQDVTLPYAPASVDATGPACNAHEQTSCDRWCESEIANPYCTQLGSWCEQTGGGGVNCHCVFFCVPHGGQQHRPQDLCVLDDVEYERR